MSLRYLGTSLINDDQALVRVRAQSYHQAQAN